jgi:hypothetical protein
MTETTKSKRPRRFARQPQTGASPTAGNDSNEAKSANKQTKTPDTTNKAVPPPKAESKIGKVVVLLSRREGATLEEMVAATGWLPHTTRAALTGLRKKGYALDRQKADGRTHYTITSEPAA